MSLAASFDFLGVVSTMPSKTVPGGRSRRRSGPCRCQVVVVCKSRVVTVKSSIVRQRQYTWLSKSPSVGSVSLSGCCRLQVACCHCRVVYCQCSVDLLSLVLACRGLLLFALASSCLPSLVLACRGLLLLARSFLLVRITIMLFLDNYVLGN